MADLVKLIEENKTYSNELQTEVLPVSVVKQIIEELHNTEFNRALNSIQQAVKEVNQSIKSIAEGDDE
jgi:hypothetical protein